MRRKNVGVGAESLHIPNVHSETPFLFLVSDQRYEKVEWVGVLVTPYSERPFRDAISVFRVTRKRF